MNAAAETLAEAEEDLYSPPALERWLALGGATCSSAPRRWSKNSVSEFHSMHI